MAKHTPNLMRATISTKLYNYDVLVDKYSGNRYKVVDGPDWAIGRDYNYGHGLTSRHKITPAFAKKENAKKGK